MKQSTRQLELEDIQGLLLRGYKNCPFAAYTFFTINGDGQSFRQWLAKQLQQGLISAARNNHTQQAETKNHDFKQSIAFTAAGLQQLMGASWIAESYPAEFVEGMVQSQRSRLLGDINTNQPENWRWGAKENIHGLLAIFAESQESLDALLNSTITEENGLNETHRIFAQLPDDGKEPFGFADGISQPIIKGTRLEIALRHRSPREHQLHAVNPGEFVLGYPDGSGDLPRSPSCSPAMKGSSLLKPHHERPELRDFGHNGSFIVVRQLAQDVKAFTNYVKLHSQDGLDIGEKMLGRTRDGESITLDPKAKNKNDFDYLDDLKGTGCPIGAHVRRTNPRSTVHANTDEGALKVSNRHRIIRRGRVYERDDGEQGLVFLCLNASISRQFEFIQSTWSNDPFFQGLQGEVDPINGSNLHQNQSFTMPAEPFRNKLNGVPQWVTVKGGGYFFMPGLRALAALAVEE